jgi:hypothetical protein
MQPEIDGGDWKVIRRPALVQRGDAPTRGDGGRQRSARRGRPIVAVKIASVPSPISLRNTATLFANG